MTQPATKDFLKATDHLLAASIAREVGRFDRQHEINIAAILDDLLEDGIDPEEAFRWMTTFNRDIGAQPAWLLTGKSISLHVWAAAQRFRMQKKQAPKLEIHHD